MLCITEAENQICSISYYSKIAEYYRQAEALTNFYLQVRLEVNTLQNTYLFKHKGYKTDSLFKFKYLLFPLNRLILKLRNNQTVLKIVSGTQ